MARENWLLDHLPDGPGPKRKIPTVAPDATAVKRPAPRPQQPVRTIGPAPEPQPLPNASPTTGLEQRFQPSRLSPETLQALNEHPLSQLAAELLQGSGHFSPTQPLGIASMLLQPELGGERALGRAAEHEIPKVGEKFAVLTAENAGGKVMPEAENLARNAQLADRIKAMGLDPVPARGAYFDDAEQRQLFENPFFVRGMTPEQAMALGKDFGQNSVLTHEGLHALNEGKLYPSRGIQVPPAEGTTYTELPNGKRFVSDLNWAEPTDLRPAATPIQVRDRAPSMLDLLDGKPQTAPSSRIIRPQTDLERFIGPRIPAAKLDAVHDEALKTYLGPEFERMTAEGNFPDWYEPERVRQMAIDALGPEQGPAAHQRLMEMMGATTARSNPDNNLRRASYYRALELNGLLDVNGLTTGAYKVVPPGMGHLANDAHHAALAGLLEEGRINPIVRPKPASFVENLTGNYRPYTNDTRMATGAAMINPKLVDLKGIVKSVGKNGEVTYSPRDWAYAPMERAGQQAATEYASRGLLEVPNGADPTAYWQAKVWDALGGMLPKASRSQGTFADVLTKAVDRNAARWGVSPSEANRLFWQGHPLDLPLGTDLLPGGLLGRF